VFDEFDVHVSHLWQGVTQGMLFGELTERFKELAVADMERAFWVLGPNWI
jgi:hypothetical protein